MDRIISEEMELELDLESGVSATEDAKLLDGYKSKNIDESIGCDDCSNDYRNSDAEESRDEAASLGIHRKEDNPKKKRTRKASKPPRPPKGPLLDAVDKKMMLEIAAIASRKRARIERIKALKKMRASKTSSCSNAIVALTVTVFFCLILILQAFYSRNRGIVATQISPEAASAGGDLMSIRLNHINQQAFFS